MIAQELNEDILKLIKRKNCYLNAKQIAKGVWAETKEELQEVNESLKYLVDGKQLERHQVTKKVRGQVVTEEPLYGLVYGDEEDE